MTLADEAATAAAGAKLARLVLPGDVITLSGPLGSGKTTFARGLIAALGHQGEVPSPSFALVQPYEDIEPPVWHADLYRIEEATELAELGLDCAEEGVLLVEWPERAPPGTWAQALRLVFEVGDDDDRSLTADVPPPWEDRWPIQ